ncbi:hypothetical protein CIB93_02360 [Streptomyces sp. WZ.A104]|nr:hypothetical protein CIB93_02360 [Streptomyces sp. WZ.A104]
MRPAKPSGATHRAPSAARSSASTGVRAAACDIAPEWLRATASPRAQGFLCGSRRRRGGATAGTEGAVYTRNHPASHVLPRTLFACAAEVLLICGQLKGQGAYAS